MMRMRKTTQILVLIVTVIFLSACGGGEQDQNGNNGIESPVVEEPTPELEPVEAPDTLTISSDLQLDPALIPLDDEDSLSVSYYVYEGLVRKMDDGSIVPGIARSWEPAEDGLSFEFRLRSDAVFSDGTPIDADIITENFNRWFDPEHPLHGPDNDVYEAWLEYFKGFRNEVDANDKPLSLFDGIEKVDNLTVLIHIYKPMPDFLEIISLPYFSILNPETLEAEGENYGTSADSVVGSGPYVIEDWSGEALTLSPSESYWGPQPQDDIVFTFE